MRKTLSVICVFTVLAFAVQAWAHHAFAAEFDANKPVKLRGTITKMDWINPHAWLHIEVKGSIRRREVGDRTGPAKCADQARLE